MASVKRMRGGCCSAVEGGQELLPGIPDHITIENIAPLIKWETCDALQMVSRQWQRAIHNRSVYDARVRSQSTKAFLVLACRFWNQELEDWEVVLTLYSCKDGFSFRLPPVPLGRALGTEHSLPDFGFDCICLDGRLYLWVTMKRDCRSFSLSGSCPYCVNVTTDERREICMNTELWALDLAGDKQWRTLRQENCAPPIYELNYGVLGGKLYRFRNVTCSDHCPPGVTGPEDLNWTEMHNFIQIEIYNPLSDTWSLITTEPYTTASNDYVPECATEQFTEALRKAYLKMNDRYEPFYSEWKRQQLTTTLTTHIDHEHGNVMVNQFYRQHWIWIGLLDREIYMESLLFFRGKLARVVQHGSKQDCTALIQSYTTLTRTWSDWKDFPYNIVTPLHIWGCAPTDDAIWAIVTMCPRTGNYLKLMRTPMLIDNKMDGEWIETAFSLDYSDKQELHSSFLRPIYI